MKKNFLLVRIQLKHLEHKQNFEKMQKFTKNYEKALKEVGGTIEDLDEEIELNDN